MYPLELSILSRLGDPAPALPPTRGLIGDPEEWADLWNLEILPHKAEFPAHLFRPVLGSMEHVKPYVALPMPLIPSLLTIFAIRPGPTSI